MLLKLLLVLSLMPLALSIFAGMYFGKNWLARKGDKELKLSAKSLLCRLLTSKNSPEIIVKKRNWGIPLEGGKLILTRAESDGVTITDLGKVVWLSGLVDLNHKSPGVLKFWRTARMFGTVGPPFIAMILIFAVVAARMSPTLALYIVVIVLGLSSALCLLQLITLRTAAKYGVSKMEKSEVFQRFDDEVAVADAAMAWTWIEAMPVCLQVVLKSQITKNSEK